MHNPASTQENETHKLLWDFEIQNELPNLCQTIRPYYNQQKKRTCQIVDFAVPADHRIKLKESEEKDKSLDLARELKKLWNMKVTVIPIVVGALGTVTKGLVKRPEDLEIRGRVETIQTIALLRSVYCIIKSPGDLRRLVVSQTSVKDPQITLMGKNLKE